MLWGGIFAEAARRVIEFWHILFFSLSIFGMESLRLRKCTEEYLFYWYAKFCSNMQITADTGNALNSTCITSNTFHFWRETPIISGFNSKVIGYIITTFIKLKYIMFTSKPSLGLLRYIRFTSRPKVKKKMESTLKTHFCYKMCCILKPSPYIEKHWDGLEHSIPTGESKFRYPRQNGGDQNIDSSMFVQFTYISPDKNIQKVSQTNLVLWIQL